MAEIAAIAREVLEPLGFEVLEVQTNQGRGRVTLLVRIDRLDEAPVSMSDLEKASNVLSLELDRLDPIPEEYKLELESPGPKRPLTRARHFERMLGLKAKVKRAGGSFVGKIVSVENETVTFEDEGGKPVKLPVEGIKANLAEWPSEHR